jgi:hypothetical protein
MYALIMVQTIIIAIASRDYGNKMLHAQGRNQVSTTNKRASDNANKQTRMSTRCHQQTSQLHKQGVLAKSPIWQNLEGIRSACLINTVTSATFHCKIASIILCTGINFSGLLFDDFGKLSHTAHRLRLRFYLKWVKKQHVIHNRHVF